MSVAKDFEKAVMAAINEDTELRDLIEGVPDQIADTVQSFVPVDTGEAKASIEVKARRSPYKRLSTRKVKIGTVLSDDDPAKVNSLEFGRSGDNETGETEEFAMFRRAAAIWRDRVIR